MVYAALGAICFTLVSLVPVLGGEAGRVEMEFRQLGRWDGAPEIVLSYLELLEVPGIPVVFCSHSLLCNDSVSAFLERSEPLKGRGCLTRLLSESLSKQDGQLSSRTFC